MEAGLAVPGLLDVLIRGGMEIEQLIDQYLVLDQYLARLVDAILVGT